MARIFRKVYGGHRAAAACLALCVSLVVIVAWGASRSSSEVDLLCEDAMGNAGLMGHPSLKLGDPLEAAGFPVSQVSSPSVRAEDRIETTRYKSSGGYGNNPGLEIETVNCAGDQIVVGIWDDFAVWGRLNVRDWEETERAALLKATGSPAALTKTDQTFTLRAVKGQLDLSGTGRTIGQTALLRRCRIDSKQSDICAFMSATVESTMFVANTQER